MQKTIACLARPSHSEPRSWKSDIEQLLLSYADQLTACGYAVDDKDVAPAHLLKMRFTEHPADAVLSLWSDNPYQLQAILNAASELGDCQAYSVVEYTAIACALNPGRIEGMCQMAFIRKPAPQPRPEWLAAWLGDHTQIAIDTQANFGYRQNVVAVALPLKQSKQPPWPLMDAIVEENFPAIAMTSREAFFDAIDDPEKFEQHQQAMMQSCARFIDFEAFDCVPMSQYIVKG
ncbi:MAG: hypothetical protein HKN50_12840 [Gammaproteobacteria bacterium]|nr:hypothetical protein [Gammaproteobacteria bacterium]